jgi:probable O-glycosylation ligase (exosortase A-associated)
MKQLAFMLVVTSVGIFGAFTHGPAIGLTVYYLYAVLRPQFMWEWSLPPGIAWSQFVAIATLLATAGYLLGALPLSKPDRRPALGLSAAHWAWLLFGLWIPLTYFAAYNKQIAFIWTQEYLKIFVMFLAASLVLRGLREIWRIYLVLTVALIYIAYEINFIYVFQGNYLLIYRRGYGGLDNNGAGLMLAMGVPMALYAWEEIRKWWRWFFAGGILFILHAVMMSYSRGAMLALILWTPFMVLRTRRKWQLVVIVAMLAVTVPIMAGQEIRQRFFSIEQYEEDGSAQSRFDSWNAAIQMSKEKPIFGYGVRNSNLFSHLYGADMEGRTIHSQYLQILADTGYPSLALYLAALSLTFWSAVRTRRLLKRRKDDPEARLMVAMVNGLEGALVIFCSGAIFLSLEVFELPYIVALLTLQLGVLARATQKAGAAETVARPARPVPTTPFARPIPQPGRAGAVTRQRVAR